MQLTLPNQLLQILLCRLALKSQGTKASQDIITDQEENLTTITNQGQILERPVMMILVVGKRDICAPMDIVVHNM